MTTNLSLAQGLLNADTTFMMGYQMLYSSQLPGEYARYTRIIPSSAKRTELNWTANHPVMAKWTGARTYKSMRHYKQLLGFDTYQATLRIKRVDLQYDPTGVVQEGINTFLQNNTVAYDAATATLFDSASGAGPTGFDGVALFATNHPQGPSGSSTQSNLGSGTNLSHAALTTAEQTMALYQFENGEPARINPNMLRVGPKLRVRARELLNATRSQNVDSSGGLDKAASVVAAAGIPSVWSGDYNMFVDPRVTNFYWTLMDLSKPGVMPMVMQENRRPEAISRTSMTDPSRWTEDEFEWALEGDFKPDAGIWMVCYRGTGTA